MRRASYTVHIAPVAHYQPIPSALAQIDLVPLLDGALDRLEQDPAFAYLTLDGCAALLEDYLTLRPEYFERVERAAQVGRLLVGPWYARPAPTITAPEPHLRNLLIGMRVARVFGPPMPVAWLPDAPALPACLPQILRGFGIQGAIQDGIGPACSPSSEAECWWQGDDGSRLLLCRPYQAPHEETRGAVGDRLVIQPWSDPIQRAAPPDEALCSNPALYVRAIERHARSHALPVWAAPAPEARESPALYASLSAQLEPALVWQEHHAPRIPRPQAILRKLWQEALRGGDACDAARIEPLIERLLAYGVPEMRRSPVGAQVESQVERVIRASDGRFEITAAKLPEDAERGGFIARGWNVSGETLSVALTPWRRFAVCQVVTPDEQPTGGTLAIDADGAIRFRAAPRRLLSFWFHD